MTARLTVVWLLVAVLAGCASAPPLAPAKPREYKPTTGTPPYERKAFGDGWRAVGRGCDVRDVVLSRDLEPEQRRGCDVVSGALRDSYTGRLTVGPARLFDVDHLVPLAYAWKLGAWRWPSLRRERFANDLANLRTTTVKINRSKGDSALGGWLPAIDRCSYARAFDAVADRYDLDDEKRDEQVRLACR